MTYRTMDEFARLCGISRPTLSKYFDDPSSIRPATRMRIETALSSYDYHPNLYARNLNRKRSKIVSIVVPTISDPFFSEIVSQFELRLRDEGYWPIIISSYGSRELEIEAIRTIQSLKVSGALIAPLGNRSDQGGLEKLARKIPMVYFDSRVEGETPFVGNNNVQSVSTMVEYLHRSGDPPVYFDYPHVNHNSSERLQSYLRTMERLGQQPQVVGQTGGPTLDYEKYGYEQAQEMLAKGTLPTKTLLCANDRLAFGVMAAAFERGIRVGRQSDCDLRIAAHDDHPLSRYMCPSLTTMAQNLEAIARRSVETLLSLLNGGDGKVAGGTTVNANLVMRQSA